MPKRDINDNLHTEKIKTGVETGNENIDLKNAIENENEKVRTANDLFNSGGEQAMRIINERIDEPTIKKEFVQENENLEKETVSANDDLRVGLENLDRKGTENAKMIDDLFREMYPAGNVNLNIEQKTDKITESINEQLLQLPHFLEMENIRYEAAQENVNSLKKDVEMAKAAGVDLSQFPDIDLSIANLYKKVSELKDRNTEEQNPASISQPDSAQSQENITKTEITEKSIREWFDNMKDKYKDDENKTLISVLQNMEKSCNAEIWQQKDEIKKTQNEAELFLSEMIATFSSEDIKNKLIEIQTYLSNTEHNAFSLRDVVSNIYNIARKLEHEDIPKQIKISSIEKASSLDKDANNIANIQYKFLQAIAGALSQTNEGTNFYNDLAKITKNLTNADIYRPSVGKEIDEMKDELLADTTKNNTNIDKKVISEVVRPGFDIKMPNGEIKNIINSKVIISAEINNENSNDSEIIRPEGGPTTAPEIEQFPDTEDSESELNLESIKKKIENNEKLSSEEERALYKMINEVSAKQENEVTETDRNIIKLYFNAFDNNLIRKGEEINSVIDQNTEEIVSFKKKNKEEKDQDINERMEKIKASGINIPKSAEEAQNFMDELEKQIQEKQEEYFKMEQDIQKIRELEGTDDETVRILGNTISSLLDINEHKLHFEYYKYMLSSLKNGNNDELYETHAQQNIMMKMLEDSVGNLKVSLERIKSGEKEALREWARWIKEHPGAGLALLATAIAAGVLISPYLAKMLAAEGVKDTAATLAGPAGKAAGLLGAKAIGGLASLAGSAGLAGLFLLLTNSEKIDDAMESIWGKKIPSWAYWGLKKKGAK